MRVLLHMACAVCLTGGAQSFAPGFANLQRPEVPGRGTCVVSNDVLCLTPKSAAHPLNMLLPLKTQSGVRYRVSYEMRAEKAGGDGGVFLTWRNPEPMPDGCCYDVRKECHHWHAPDRTDSFLAIFDSGWRLYGGMPVDTNWVGYSYCFALPPGCDEPVLVFSARTPGAARVEYRNFRVEEDPAENARAFAWLNAVEERRGGSTCVRFVAQQHATAALSGTPGRPYRMSFKVNSREAAGKFEAFDMALKDGTNVLDECVADTSLAGTTLTKTLEATMPASGRMTLDLMSYGRKGRLGKSHYWDFKMEPFVPQEKKAFAVVLDEPAYKGTIYATSPHRNVAGHLTGSVRGAKVELVAKSDPAKVLAATNTADGAFVLRKTDDLPVGDYLVRVSQEGVVVDCPVRKVAPSPSEVSFRDGQMLFNGKPYFFTGRWGPPDYRTEAMFYGHARHGLTVQLWGISPRTSQQFLKDLDLAERFHSKLIPNICFNPNRYHESGYFEKWQAETRALFTPQVIAHPALLGYYMCDEPGYGGVGMAPLEAAYRHMNELDPYHPCWINEAPFPYRNRHQRNLSACDVYGVDIYPVPASHGHSGLEDKEMTSVGGFTEMFREMLGKSRPTWMVLQGMSWQSVADKVGPTDWPMRDQTRFMAFDAIVHGASGSIYWGMWHTRGKKSNPGNIPFYADLLDVTKEIRSLDPLWVAGNVLELPKASGIETFAARICGKRFIVALNRTKAPCAVAFQVEDLRVLPGGRAAEAKDVTIPAFGVRVFADSPTYPSDGTCGVPYDECLEKAFQDEVRTFLTE